MKITVKTNSSKDLVVFHRGMVLYYYVEKDLWILTKKVVDSEKWYAINIGTGYTGQCDPGSKNFNVVTIKEVVVEHEDSLTG